MAMRIQGTYYSNAEARTRIMWDGGEFVTTDWQSLDWSDKVEVSVVPGQGRMPLGRTAGQYKADDAKATLLLDKYIELQAALKLKADADGVNVCDVEFDISTIWVSGTNNRTALIKACRLIGRGQSTKSGDTKAEEVPMTLSVAYVLVDGVCLVNPTED